MDGILSFLKDFDMETMLPAIGTFVGRLKFIMWALMMVSPVLLLILGANYYFKPPKEANFSWGFRTYFGMGSVEVWRFTQKIAGRLWMLLGGAMTAICLVLGLLMLALNAYAAATLAIWCVSIQLVLVIAVWVAINWIVLKYYDKDGNRRPQK